MCISALFHVPGCFSCAKSQKLHLTYVITQSRNLPVFALAIARHAGLKWKSGGGGSGLRASLLIRSSPCTSAPETGDETPDCQPGLFHSPQGDLMAVMRPGGRGPVKGTWHGGRSLLDKHHGVPVPGQSSWKGTPRVGESRCCVQGA